MLDLEPDIIAVILDILMLYRQRASLWASRCFICSLLITLRKKTHPVPVPGRNLLEATAERVPFCVFCDVHFWCRESFLVWILQKRKYVDHERRYSKTRLSVDHSIFFLIRWDRKLGAVPAPVHSKKNKWMQKTKESLRTEYSKMKNYFENLSNEQSLSFTALARRRTAWISLLLIAFVAEIRHCNKSRQEESGVKWTCVVSCAVIYQENHLADIVEKGEGYLLNRILCAESWLTNVSIGKRTRKATEIGQFSLLIIQIIQS